MCPKPRKYSVLAWTVGLFTLAAVGSAQEGVGPFVISSFDPDIGTLVGVGFDSASDEVWIYASDDNFLMSYSATGTFLSSIARPGGAYHPTRDTFFLVEDFFNIGAPSTVAEIDLATGVVMNSFRTDGFDDYDVNFGDLDVDTFTGNLLIVSSAETKILELTPTGAFVRAMPLPAGVSSLSGIAIVDDEIGNTSAWSLTVP